MTRSEEPFSLSRADDRVFGFPRRVACRFLESALQEDLGERGDLTTQVVCDDPDRLVEGKLIARSSGVIAGLPAFELAFGIYAKWLYGDRFRMPDWSAWTWHEGTSGHAGDVICRFNLPLCVMLGAERTALNVLSTLSGVATQTHMLVQAVAPFETRLLCTRKTLPNMRALQKYAVRVGGGTNHRYGLDDVVMIKDNHVAAVGSVRACIEAARRRSGPYVSIVVEVDNLAQLSEALESGAKAILLDNFENDGLCQAVSLNQGRATLEASGGINVKRAVEIAQTGVDFISAGCITQSAPAIDFSLQISDKTPSATL